MHLGGLIRPRWPVRDQELTADMTHIPPRTEGALDAQAESSLATRTLLRPAQAFIYAEGSVSRLMLGAVVIALVWANSPWSSAYHSLWEQVLTVDVGLFSVSEELKTWINDGLMAVFFFAVTLELKRELIHGQLSKPERAALPVAAALGGMLVPAALFLWVNGGGEGARGWAIATPTDIAFAVGVLALLGRRITSELALFLLAFAVVDDVGVILVIAIFYTESLSFASLAIAGGLFSAIVAMRHLGVRSFSVYIIGGVLFWVAVLNSGVHATIAGVALAMLTPSRPSVSRERFAADTAALMRGDHADSCESDEDAQQVYLARIEHLARETESPLERLERTVQPWNGYLVLPLFAFANAGLGLGGGAMADALGSPVAAGILLGRVVGKPVGLVLGAWLAVRAGVATLPELTTWPLMWGVGAVAGVGFSVSVFIATLTFDGPELSQAKIAIFAATVLTGVAGYGLLRFQTRDVPHR